MYVYEYDIEYYAIDSSKFKSIYVINHYSLFVPICIPTCLFQQ